ncbi:type VII secretion protein EccB [Micromonospora sp. NPDC050397]|uniref:type VII secretion protein EccB n=1 Tax=Micromonospora sp. NPDC050397 TaxID=3364279 RepID=UPI0038508913
MQSRRDQVQAQSYVLGRLTSALVAAEPEAPENPHRRLLVGTVAGVLVAALVVAGFTVYGFLRPGGATGWRKPGTVVVEKETGSRYVLVDGRLRPVLNYSSALLLFGQKPAVSTVSAASLRTVPRGASVGIVGAPDALPGPTALAGATWTVCAVAGRDDAGTLATATTLTVDRAPVGPPVGADQGIVARAPGGETFLVWRGRRFALTQTWLSRAFGYDAAPVQVEPGWLDQLPAGSDIGPLAVSGRGDPGPTIDGRPTRIGQLFVARVAGTAERHYLLRRDGLSQLTPTGVAVVSSDPETARAYGGQPVIPVELTAAALTGLPGSKEPVLPGDLPESPPAVAGAGPGQVWCLHQGTANGIELTAESPLPARGVAPGDGVGVTRTARTATAVAIAAGIGGLVRLGRPGQAPGTSYFVVTDAGIKYPLVNPSVAKALGYSTSAAVTVPPALLELLPTGPLLDPARARG